MKLLRKMRIRPSELERAPWRFVVGGETLQGVSIQDGQVIFSDRPGSGLYMYVPGYDSISVFHNLASVADNHERLPLVAASLGSLDNREPASESLKPTSESLAEWIAAAGLLQEARNLLHGEQPTPDEIRGDSYQVPVAKLIDARIFEHGQPRALTDPEEGEVGWYYDYQDLVGVGLFEAAEDLFQLISGKPRNYAECSICTRWFRMKRRDQRYCGQPCNAKAHRERLL